MIERYLPKGYLQVQGETFLHLASTNYLGTAFDKVLASLFAKGVDMYGSYVSLSRASNASLNLYEQADKYVAKWLGTEDALVFSSDWQRVRPY